MQVVVSGDSVHVIIVSMRVQMLCFCLLCAFSAMGGCE